MIDRIGDPDSIRAKRQPIPFDMDGIVARAAAAGVGHFELIHHLAARLTAMRGDARPIGPIRYNNRGVRP